MADFRLVTSRENFSIELMRGKCAWAISTTWSAILSVTREITMIVVPSKYYLELEDEEAKKRYNEKLIYMCILKPQKIHIVFWKIQVVLLVTVLNGVNGGPDVILYADVYNYLILTPSTYTHEQLKAYKSLDGYNFFINGWVSSVMVTCTGTHPKSYLFTPKSCLPLL